MILVLPLVAGLVAGRLLGGNFRSLASTPIHFGWLFVLGLLVQLALFTSLTDTQSWDITYSHALYVVSLVLVLAALLLNIGRLQWPVMVLIAGAALNFVVILANGGAMPVDTHLLAQVQGQQVVMGLAAHHFASNVVPLSGSTVFGFLGDRFPIWIGVYSIGDLALGIGVLVAVVVEMNRQRFSIRARLAPARSRSSLSQAA